MQIENNPQLIFAKESDSFHPKSIMKYEVCSKKYRWGRGNAFDYSHSQASWYYFLIIRTLSTKCGGSLTPYNFSSIWATKELDSSNDLIIHEPSRKNTQKVQFAIQIEIFREDTFCSTTHYCRLCATAHEHDQTSWFWHKNYNSFSSLVCKGFEVRSTSDEEIRVMT